MNTQLFLLAALVGPQAFALPDLELNWIESTQNAVRGDAFSVIYEVENTGDQPSGTFTSYFRVHTFSSYSTSGDVVCTHSVPSMAPGEVQVLEVTGCTLPSGRQTGLQHIVGRVDALVVVSESSESNNTNSDSIDVLASSSSSPDIRLGRIWGPEVVSPGELIEVSYILTNAGGGLAGPHNTRVRLSTDAQYDSTDPQVCDLAVSTSIDGYSARVESGATCVIPSSTTPGPYYLVANGDAFADVAESNEGNNRTSVAIDVELPSGTPDLTVSSVSVASTVSPGDALSPQITVTNQGNGLAGVSVLEVVWSDDSTLDSGDPVLCSVSVPSMGAGQSQTVNPAGCFASFAATTGTKTLFAVVDVDGNVSESSETNNTGSTTLTVSGGTTGQADLTAVLDALPEVAPGGLLPVAFTLTNEGEAPAEGFGVELRLSDNPLLGDDDPVICELDNLSLLPGTSSQRTIQSCAIDPAVAPGSYVVFLVADPEELVVEVSEFNNVASASLLIRAETDNPPVDSDPPEPPILDTGVEDSAGDTALLDTGSRPIEPVDFGGDRGVAGCSCNTGTGPSGALGWLSGLALLAAARRRP